MWRHLRGFIRAFRSDDGPALPDHSGHSVARAVRDSSTVAGTGMSGGGVNTSNDAQMKIIAKGHQDYSDSFDADD